MKDTKIDWCDMSWNPVTGCFHGCSYCYARGITKRFGGRLLKEDGRLHVLDEPFEYSLDHYMSDGYKIDPYPYIFDPTFHRYRLNQPQRIKKPQTIFVGSMCDLFGAWVPDSWIEAVFEACMAAPQHRYLFLTKNPARYSQLDDKGKLPSYENLWYGSTTTTPDDVYYRGSPGTTDRNRFLSIEPLLAHFERFGKIYADYVIIGAETGNRKDRIIPEREWIENIVKRCRVADIPIFMKNNLATIWGKPLIQEYPWEVL